MRKTLFLLFALALAYPAAAHADTITFSVSVIGSGSFGDTVFTDKRVTFTESQPAELVTEGVIESGGIPSSFGLCFAGGSTVTVQGLGTSGGPQSPCVFHNFTGGGDYYIADSDGNLRSDPSPAMPSSTSTSATISEIPTPTRAHRSSAT
jgi:hypothetical protein